MSSGILTLALQKNDFTFIRLLESINGRKKELGARERQAQSPITCLHYAPFTISHITSKQSLYRLLTSCLLISVCDRFLLISLLETLSLHDWNKTKNLVNNELQKKNNHSNNKISHIQLYKYYRKCCM